MDKKNIRPKGKDKDLEKMLYEAYDEFKTAADEYRKWSEPQNPPNYQKVCVAWARHDFWPLKEGLNLLCRCRPQKQRWDFGIKELWNLGKRCIGPGGTLKVVNPDVSAWSDGGRAKKLQIKPTDLLDWADAKRIPIPFELSDAIRGNDVIEGSYIINETQTTQATLQRTLGKEQRHEALQEFLDDIQQRVHDMNLNWDITTIPVTKKDFQNVFHRLYTDISPVGSDQFGDDLKEFGAKFQRGTKNRTDNILVKIFPELK